MRLVLDEVIVNRARLHGAAGEAWLRGLDDLAASLAAEWGLTLGGLMRGGTEAAVIEATLPDGRPAVLKLTIPGQDPDLGEQRVLLACGPASYPQVYRHDTGRRALLLERLGPQLHDSGLPVDVQIAIICRTLRGAWVSAPQDGFIDGARKARDLAAFIEDRWERLGRPCARRTVDLALGYAEHRAAAHDPERAVLAHGDAHAWNTLAIPGEPGRYKFVDPDGLIVEPAYDLAIPMREWGAELAGPNAAARGAARARMICALTGVDAESVWQWGLMERVATGLMGLEIGFPDVERDFLQVADAWAADPAF